MPSSTTNRGGSKAAIYNAKVLKKLQKVLITQPDIDITSVLPSRYSSILESKTRLDRGNGSRPHDMSAIKTLAKRDTSSLCVTSPIMATIAYPLSEEVSSLLSATGVTWTCDANSLAKAMLQLISSATRLFTSSADSEHFVARCSTHIVLKAISSCDSTEYTSLLFLSSALPEFPVPKPHGVVVIGQTWYMFMEFIPGITLQAAWPSLSEEQKTSISSELHDLLVVLHQVPHTPETQLGGVCGEGCKDTRRHTRIMKNLYSVEDVWEFMYGSARNRDSAYGLFLRKNTFPPRPQRIMFIHGDLRPSNIMIQIEHEKIRVTGVIDWEMSGFYPEDLECVKTLNTLSPLDDTDWFSYLPACVDPRRHLMSWHTDCVWDPYVV